MNRRKFLTLLGLAPVVAPTALKALETVAPLQWKTYSQTIILDANCPPGHMYFLDSGVWSGLVDNIYRPNPLYGRITVSGHRDNSALPPSDSLL